MSFEVCSCMLRIAADVVALKASVAKFLISYVFTQQQQTPKCRVWADEIKHHSVCVFIFEIYKKNPNRILNVKTFDDF